MSYSFSEVDEIYYSTFLSSATFHAAVQNEIVSCMASLGFDYRPEPYREPPSVTDTPIVDSQIDWMLRRDELPHGEQMAREFAMGNDLQYLMALHGREGIDLGEALEEMPAAEEYGCHTYAAYKVVGLQGFRATDDLTRLLGELGERVASDPQVVEASLAFNECFTRSDYSSMGEEMDREMSRATLDSPVTFWDQMRELEREMNAIHEECSQSTRVWIITDEVEERLWRDEYQDQASLVVAEVQRMLDETRTE